MGETWQAVLLLFLLMVGGVFITFNLVESVLHVNLGLGFHNISGISSGIWIVVARLLVGPALILVTGYTIWGIIKS